MYDNTNRGAIWPNRNKATENHPDFTGSLNVDGVEYWVSGWKKAKDAKEGAPSLSFQIQKKNAAPNGGQSYPQQQVAAPSGEFDDQDIPFR